MIRPAWLAMAVLAVGSCAPPPRDGRTFVLLTIDTLRADHLGAYGYPGGTSPALDRLGRQSVTLIDFVSVSSWTMPAMGTLATGLRPNEHGMIYWHLPLADVPETMAEVLEAAGVTTAFFGNPIPRLPGLDRGFGRWEIFEGDDDAALAAAIDWLRETDGRDRFLWLHLLSPHAPYDPRPGTVRSGGRATKTHRYDGEIRTTDSYVDELLGRLDATAAVVVTADHGETLDERSELAFDHGKFLFEELVRIPCLARIPGSSPGIDREPAQLADVPATACDWLGVEPPTGSYGASLLPRLRGEGREVPDLTFAFVVEDEPPAAKDRRWAVRGDGMKAVFNLDRDTVRLFDLREDPGETVDVSARFPEEVARRRAALDEWLARMPTPTIPFGRRFTRDELDRLQSLGYLGGAK